MRGGIVRICNAAMGVKAPLLPISVEHHTSVPAPNFITALTRNLHAARASEPSKAQALFYKQLPTLEFVLKGGLPATVSTGLETKGQDVGPSPLRMPKAAHSPQRSPRIAFTGCYRYLSAFMEESSLPTHSCRYSPRDIANRYCYSGLQGNTNICDPNLAPPDENTW